MLSEDKKILRSERRDFPIHNTARSMNFTSALVALDSHKSNKGLAQVDTVTSVGLGHS